MLSLPFRRGRRRRRGRPPIIVLEPLDVVLSHVLPHLYLDDDEVFLADALYPMEDTQRDIDRFSRQEPDGLLAARHRRLRADHLPMLRPPTVPLETHAAPRPHDELLHLVSGVLVQHQVISPGAIAPLHRQTVLRCERYANAMSLYYGDMNRDYLSIALILARSFFTCRSVALYGFSTRSSFSCFWRSLARSFSFVRAPSMVNRSS